MEFEPLHIEQNHVMEFDMGDDDTVVLDIQHPVEVDDDDQEEEEEESDHVPLLLLESRGDFYIPPDGNLEPYEGMEFESEESAKAFYNSYARRVGFGTRVSMSSRSKRDGAIILRSFVCAKEGFRVDRERPAGCSSSSSTDAKNNNKVKRPRAATRMGCKASMVVKVQSSEKWVVSYFEREHNHDLVPLDKVHCLRSHRHVSGNAKVLIDTLQGAGMGPSAIMAVLIKEYGGVNNVGFTERDCRNYMRSCRQKTLGGDTRVLLDYLKQLHAENPSFFYSVQGDEDHYFSNVFWVDSKARMNYTYFGDTVTFDTTYRTNRYRLPFAPFTGLNHHGQPVLFGCALLINESEESFVWLFKTWLAAMSGRHPVSITTDYDRVIRSAITEVLPETRHRFCKWHIFKEGQEKLSHLFLEYPNLESEFHKCVNLTESVEEFESCWLSLIARYGLGGHEWLESVYVSRRHWVPVYLRDTFFAEMSITQRSDSINSYFDGYLNASTALPYFTKLYEKAVESRYEKEVKADFETINTTPDLKTPSPMEKQAAEVYTKKLFTKFQEELVETLTFMATKMEDGGSVTRYRVSKFGEDHRAYFVKFNVLEMEATCSCQMFEFSGLLCRHVLTVFRVTNVLKLPSHYVLKRWTRNAKSGVLLEERPRDLLNSYRESQTVRYNNLRHEALKYASEGAKTTDIYYEAMFSLQEAAKKVAYARKNGGKLPILNISSQEDNGVDGVYSNAGHQLGFGQSQSADGKDKKIQELSVELDRSNRKSNVYRANLLAILKDIEEQKLQLSVKVQNLKIGMRES